MELGRMDRKENSYAGDYSESNNSPEEKITDRKK